MKVTLQREDPRVLPVNWTDYVRTLHADDEPKPAFWSPPEEPAWVKQAEREFIAAAHRAERAKAREERLYGGCPAFLPPHPVLLRETWAVEQLHTLPDGKPRRGNTMPRLKWSGGGVSPRRTEQNGNTRRFAGKRF
ncbi:MAG: hypothetical protein LUD78_05685 [Clostridiales bacterium]|nr:hypothetical protein [Clostridiales bacterium]